MHPMKPPSGLRAAGKAAFRQLLKEMAAQGLVPEKRLAEIVDYGLLCDEQLRLLREGKEDIPLATRIALGRRISGIIAQRTKLKSLIFQPPPGERRLGKKELAMRAAGIASSRFPTPAAPRAQSAELREWEALAGENREPKPKSDVLDRYLNGPRSSKWDELLPDDDGDGGGDAGE
jgi:hypothetical protein